MRKKPKKPDTKRCTVCGDSGELSPYFNTLKDELPNCPYPEYMMLCGACRRGFVDLEVRVNMVKEFRLMIT